MLGVLAIGCARSDRANEAEPPLPTASVAPTVLADTPTPSPKYSFAVREVDFGALIAAAEDPGFLRLLDAVPDTPRARRQVWLNDFRYMWRFLEQRGIARPGRDDPSDAVLEALRKLAYGDTLLLPWPDSAPWIAGGLGSDYPVEYVFYGDSGVDARNVDLAARTGRGQAHQGMVNGDDVGDLEVVLGDYDPALIRARLDSCRDCVPHEVRHHGGVEYLAWGEDLQPNLRTRLKPPWTDLLGRGGRVALFDGKIVRALGTPAIEGLIDDHIGVAPSLADDPKFANATRALDALGVYAGVISSADFSLSGLRKHLQKRWIGQSDGRFGIGFAQEGIEIQVSGSVNETPVATPVDRPAETVVASAPLLRPFEVAAFGQLPQRDQSSRQVVIVLVHGNAEAARANARLLLDRLQDTKFSDSVPLYADWIQLVEFDITGEMLIFKITADARRGLDLFSPAALADVPLTVHE